MAKKEPHPSTFNRCKFIQKEKKLDWTKEMDKAFIQMKQIIAQETILALPDYSKPFQIYTDASDYQLGGVIQQEGKPLAFYSRKLNKAQKTT